MGNLFDLNLPSTGWWIWPLVAVGLALWLTAYWVIWQFQKFRRKVQWTILASAAFPFVQAHPSPNASLTLGIPLGAIYVICFWRIGSSPIEASQDNAALPKDLNAFLGSKAGFMITLLGAFALYILSIAAGIWSALLLIASGFIACQAIHVRGQVIARHKAAAVASTSWCVSALLLAAWISLGGVGHSDLIPRVLGIGAIIAIWPAFICLPPLAQDTWLSTS